MNSNVNLSKEKSYQDKAYLFIELQKEPFGKSKQTSEAEFSINLQPGI
jgi:hypothetical protein